MQVWLKDGRNDRVRANVSNKIRHILNLDPSQVTLYYKEHVKAIKDGSTMRNAEGFKFVTPKQPELHNKPMSYQQYYHGGEKPSYGAQRMPKNLYN